MAARQASPRVLVAQIGARRHYLVPRVLAEAGCLERFYTDIYFGRRRLLDPAIACALGRRAADFGGRCHPALPMTVVSDFPCSILGNRARSGSQTRRWMVAGSRFGASVVRRGFGRADTVLAFSSAAQEIFEKARTKGITTVLDHATAPRSREMAAVAQEEDRFPGWTSCSVLGDTGLQPYSERQARERELADRILCGSTFVAGLLGDEGVNPARIRVLPLGVDTTFFGVQRPSRAAGKNLHVLFVGSEGLRKGLGYLLDALSSLRSSRIRLRIAGNPGFTARGMSRVQSLCEECRSVSRAEIRDWYGWADVLVLPTISDTFGLVILEAMASGLPVIATAASGGPDVIRDGVEGWIVPLRDPSSIAERLERLISSPGSAAVMGAAARVRAAEFDLHAYRRRLLEAIAID
jgi:glycosyltransferase involved in cell wall biosynthesis